MKKKAVISAIILFAFSANICYPAMASGNNFNTDQEKYRQHVQEFCDQLLENNTGEEKLLTSEEISEEKQNDIHQIATDNTISFNTPESAYRISVGGLSSKFLEAKNEIWFKFSTVESPNYQGAYHISSSGEIDVVGYLYKMKPSGSLELLGSNDDSGEKLNFSMQLTLKGSETYYLKVKGFTPETQGKFKVQINRNIDTLEYAGGGTWRPVQNSPIPEVNAITYKKVYLPLEPTKELYEAVMNDEYSSMNSWLAGIVGAEAISKIAMILHCSPNIAVFIYGAMIMSENVNRDITEKNIYMNSGRLTHGIAVTFRNRESNYYIEIDSWDSNIMTGEEGYIGEFLKDQLSTDNYE